MTDRHQHSWRDWEDAPAVVSLDGRRWQSRVCVVCGFEEYRPARVPWQVTPDVAVWHEGDDMGDEQR